MDFLMKFEKLGKLNPQGKNVPPALPEPTIGINYPSDKMDKKEWLIMAATHSDAWFMSLATYYYVGYKFERKERLFWKIANLPTISDLLMSSEESNDGISSSKFVSETGEEDMYFCGKCNEKYVEGEFWICCDTCQEWFHCICVNMNAEKAENVKQYNCPSCSSNKMKD